MKSKKQSAGILIFRRKNAALEFMLVHPGGPIWKNKDEGAWSIPKGEFTDEEDALAAAQRELKEELGMELTGEFISLAPVKLKSGKTVYAWALEADLNTELISSNTCQIEWPPRSGKRIDIPEIDKGAWFNMSEAKQKINPAQAAFLDELSDKIS
jgi:predicted NUDIX family NTP pyrophosphohydrolase